MDNSTHAPCSAFDTAGLVGSVARGIHVTISVKTVLFLSGFVLAAHAQSEPIRATIDAGATQAPISKYVYGQFIEHIGSIINHGLWAETLDDRKFYYAPTTNPPSPPTNASPRSARLALQRWRIIGPSHALTMDTTAPYVGKQSPVVRVDPSDPRGISQAGLAVRRG